MEIWLSYIHSLMSVVIAEDIKKNHLSKKFYSFMSIKLSKELAWRFQPNKEKNACISLVLKPQLKPWRGFNQNPKFESQ